MHFVTQFTQVSRHFLVYSRKSKKKLGKTVWKMWSQICEKKNGLCVHTTTFRKSAKTKKKKKKRKTMKAFTIFGGFWGQN